MESVAAALALAAAATAIFGTPTAGVPPNVSQCIYQRTSEKITCTASQTDAVAPDFASVTCRVRAPLVSSEKEDGGPLPPRHYRLGPVYNHPWYGLAYYDIFRPRSDGNYWQEHAQTEDYNGRRRFGLSVSAEHEGISVLSRSCWRKLARAIDSGSRATMRVHSPEQSIFSPATPSVTKSFVADLIVE